jgi:competence protein ComEC
VPGNKINLGGGAVIEVLWPPRQSALNSNDSGLVLRLTYAGRSVLFPADIQVDAQSLLLDSPNQLKSDVLIAPHHGSREETTSAFISAVNPSIILSSNDRTLTMKQADFEDTFAGRKLYRTHRDGSVTVRISKQGELVVGTFAEMR